MHLFAGVGGGILGGMLLGHRPVCAVEIDPFCRDVLLARQADGSLPLFPIHDDINTFNANAWQGRVDIVAGGFPCQDLSAANYKAQGLAGARSSLWFEMLRVVNECRPRFVFVENSPAIRTRGLATVLEGLAGSGYHAAWGVPVANDSKNTRNATAQRSPGKSANPGVTLCDYVLMATPTARDWRSGKASAATHARNSRPLSEQIGGYLNPDWVELLMGWPRGWTNPDDGLPDGTKA